MKLIEMKIYWSIFLPRTFLRKCIRRLSAKVDVDVLFLANILLSIQKEKQLW